MGSLRVVSGHSRMDEQCQLVVGGWNRTQAFSLGSCTLATYPPPLVMVGGVSKDVGVPGEGLEEMLKLYSDKEGVEGLSGKIKRPRV